MGVYALKTNVSKDTLTKEAVRTLQRPRGRVCIPNDQNGHVRNPTRLRQKRIQTRGHVLVTMLAYMIAQSFWNRSSHFSSPQLMLEVMSPSSKPFSCQSKDQPPSR